MGEDVDGRIAPETYHHVHRAISSKVIYTGKIWHLSFLILNSVSQRLRDLSGWGWNEASSKGVPECKDLGKGKCIDGCAMQEVGKIGEVLRCMYRSRVASQS